ncbi:DUF805 domain-containing protein [Kitasatospora sp. NPDC085879]|uniref:DUF805 domain-containing protein n=1 Tax=Kitasatospora sp. NPDC085879 TaxID=3154769 RepID=UPI000BB0EB0B|nr:DUF805 domain-containing protein [Streptomyces sp. TLI_235]PBC70879.1 uncharacterized membrane protein YhaH (DUF805 family) [Streptomyces sp. TLI_235]
MDWYLAVLKNYAGFGGRARRKEYWMFALVNIAIYVVLAIVGNLLDTALLTGLYGLAVLVPSLAVGVRRLHDTGRSGWWLLIGLIPLIGGIVLIVFAATEGQPEVNAYGPSPKAIPAAA